MGECSKELKVKKEERLKETKTLDKYDRLWDRRDTARHVLHDQEYIDIHLRNSVEILVCRLLEWGMFEVLVEFVSNGKVIKALIHKHSIKFIVIKGD